MRWPVRLIVHDIISLRAQREPGIQAAVRRRAIRK
jgi:hypothetical protein